MHKFDVEIRKRGMFDRFLIVWRKLTFALRGVATNFRVQLF